MLERFIDNVFDKISINFNVGRASKFITMRDITPQYIGRYIKVHGGRKGFIVDEGILVKVEPHPRTPSEFTITIDSVEGMGLWGFIPTARIEVL
jgi:hypothetical protein